MQSGVLSHRPVWGGGRSAAPVLLICRRFVLLTPAKVHADHDLSRFLQKARCRKSSQYATGCQMPRLKWPVARPVGAHLLTGISTKPAPSLLTEAGFSVKSRKRRCLLLFSSGSRVVRHLDFGGAHVLWRE